MNTRLYLTLHKKWFDLIASGEKKVEYRAKTPFWEKRLVGKIYSEIFFRNGYSPKSPTMRVQCLGRVDTNWEGAPCHGLLLGDVLEINR